MDVDMDMLEEEGMPLFLSSPNLDSADDVRRLSSSRRFGEMYVRADQNSGGTSRSLLAFRTSVGSNQTEKVKCGGELAGIKLFKFNFLSHMNL